jgi:hypothetical protein
MSDDEEFDVSGHSTLEFYRYLQRCLGYWDTPNCSRLPVLTMDENGILAKLDTIDR